MRTLTFVFLIACVGSSASAQPRPWLAELAQLKGSGQSDHRCVPSGPFIAAAQSRALVVRIKVLALPERPSPKR